MVNKNFKPSIKSKLKSSSINYTLDKQPTKITFKFLKSHLWSAADILRGSLDPSEYRQPVMTLHILKRLNDTFEENAENLIKKGRSKKEAKPYIEDFKFLSQKRQMLRNFYGGVATSLREDGKKVQQLIDDHIRSLKISNLMEAREVTDETFLSDVVKITKDKSAQTALIKSKAAQIISSKAHLNPAYDEKMKERLENLIREVKEKRKEDADYFNNFKQILEELLDEKTERKKLGLSNPFEFAIYEELSKLTKVKETSIKFTK